MNYIIRLFVLAAGSIGLTTPVAAQPINSMLSACEDVGKSYFRNFEARADMKYNGQRVDGTHAVNGRIFLETRFEDIACSFASSGRSMVEFFAEGRVQNAYLPGNQNPSGDQPANGNVVRVTGVRANDVLNVRAGPSPRERIVGALGNGSSVINLGCQNQGNARWCQIEMMTDMRERGWVNARYLSGVGGSSANIRQPNRDRNQDGDKAAAVIGAIVGAIALAATSKDHRHEHHKSHKQQRHDYGAPFSPHSGVTCYPRERTCYRSNGRVAMHATERYFR